MLVSIVTVPFYFIVVFNYIVYNINIHMGINSFHHGLVINVIIIDVVVMICSVYNITNRCVYVTVDFFISR